MDFNEKLESEIADLEFEEHERLRRLRDKEIERQDREDQIIKKLKMR